MPRLIAVFVLAALCAGVPAAAQTSVEAASETTWMTVLLSGHKIGHVELERRREGTTLTTTQTLALEFNRSGRKLRLGTLSRSAESLEGQPLGFGARTGLSAQDSTVTGRRETDGRFRVTTTVGGQSRDSLIDWPQGALLAEAQRQAILAAGRQAGTRYQLREFDPASQQVVVVDMQVIGDEKVALPESTETLSHQRQNLGLGQGGQTFDLWLDEHGIARRGTMPLFGQALEMLACSRACALAPNHDVDMFRATMVGSPRPLPPYLRAAPLRYNVRVKGGDQAPPFINTDEQRVVALGKNEWQLDVGGARAGGQPPPRAEDRAPNAWLQSDAPAIRALAAKAVGDARDDRNRMRRLRRFVSDYITEHGLDVGYASALEVVNSRQGDCTEYAVLLAALARAQGIPARVVSGMVYAERYAGALRVFVPHEWMQAWVDGRWQSYDAALRRFDTTHLALASGDGAPWHFFAATRLFGNLVIRQVRPSAELMSMPAPATAGGNSAGAAASGN